MIQRVQSIWLLLTSLALLLLLVVPIVSKLQNGAEFTIYTSGLHEKISAASGTTIKAEVFLPLMIANIFVALVAFFNIFAFKNRTLQKRICNVVIILTAGLSFWISQAALKLPAGLEGASYGAGAFLPILAIIFCFLAIRGIRKDEQLIKSADRLR